MPNQSKTKMLQSKMHIRLSRTGKNKTEKNQPTMLRFYTLPPAGVNYPYLLVNPNNYKALYKIKFKHAILDCGVEIFKHNPTLSDYPKSFLHRWKWKAKQLTEIFGERLWVTIPDYPDDYNPGQFGDNVTKTLRNIEEFIAVDGVNWLPSIQSRYLDKFSFLESCQKLKEIIGNYPQVAIGTVCKTNRLDFITYCCHAARKHFPNSWIHAFGLTLKALATLAKAISSWDSLVPECGRTKWRYRLIDSFDSLAYTFPRESHKPSCKNLDDRRKYFYAYLAHVQQIIAKQANTSSATYETLLPFVQEYPSQQQ